MKRVLETSERSFFEIDNRQSASYVFEGNNPNVGDSYVRLNNYRATRT